MTLEQKLARASALLSAATRRSVKKHPPAHPASPALAVPPASAAPRTSSSAADAHAKLDPLTAARQRRGAS